jgi:hypothetical protein
MVEVHFGLSWPEKLSKIIIKNRLKRQLQAVREEDGFVVRD